MDGEGMGRDEPAPKPDCVTICTLLWDANDRSFGFSRMYDESWAEKLYRGFQRNLTVPFRFVCFTDRHRRFKEPIEQEPIWAEGEIGYDVCTQPFRLDAPMILTGLDTVVVGNCDALAAYCMDEAHKVAVPRDPFAPYRACNGVVLCSGGKKAEFFDGHDGENDMEWIRLNEHAFIDDLFPKAVVSFKGYTQHFGIEDETAIVYFHGEDKPHQLGRLDWVQEHWR